jgi:hypothetical protein
MTMEELKSLPEGRRAYLGDGLYAGYDGQSIWLVAPRENGDHAVCLGRDEFDALDRFRERLR